MDNMAYLPVPYFEIDENFRIGSVSDSARALFPDTEYWFQLVDEGSLDKAGEYLSPSHSGFKVELILRTRMEPFVPFDVYQHWGPDGTGYVVCICQQGRYQTVTNQLSQLEESLRQGVHGIHGRTAPLNGMEIQAQPLLNSSKSVSRELCATLETVRDLVDLLYPSLLEIDQTTYADIIKEQIDTALKDLPYGFRR
ncbi:hypothetical protein ACTHPF_17610 [Paenibacillus sp. SAF-054]